MIHTCHALTHTLYPYHLNTIQVYRSYNNYTENEVRRNVGSYHAKPFIAHIQHLMPDEKRFCRIGMKVSLELVCSNSCDSQTAHFITVLSWRGTALPRGTNYEG
jgi:hypothetical protein